MLLDGPRRRKHAHVRAMPRAPPDAVWAHLGTLDHLETYSWGPRWATARGRPVDYPRLSWSRLPPKKVLSPTSSQRT
eukprot:2425754-Pyramimonas_sp.AAC.1